MNPALKEQLYKIVLAPRITEKAARVADSMRQYVFEVAKDSTKPQIKRAVEALFSVEVEDVRVVNVKGKRRFFRQMAGKRKDWKKAYVSLKEGHDISFVGKE